MKKFAVLFAALLQCFLAYSQEAESGNEESSAQLLIIPRLDVNPYLKVSQEGESGIDMGDSALYTLFEGELGDSPFSYSVANLWLNTDPAPLYSNTLRTDELNWLTWAYINYTAGSFDFTLGKDSMSVGTYEIDAYDFDSYSPISSSFWNDLQVYQWAAKLGYTLPDESLYLSLQASTSPFGEKPFSSGLYAYTAHVDAYLGDNSLMMSASKMQTGAEDWWLLALGDTMELGDITLGIDAYNASFGGVRFGSDEHFSHFALAPSVRFDSSEKLSVMLKGIYENTLSDNQFTIGALAEYYPIEGSRDLRLHGVMAHNCGTLYLSLGLTYFFNLL